MTGRRRGSRVGSLHKRTQRSDEYIFILRRVQTKAAQDAFEFCTLLCDFKGR